MNEVLRLEHKDIYESNNEKAKDVIELLIQSPY